MYQETKVAVLMKTMQRNSSAPSNSRTSQLLQALEYNGHCPGAGQGSCHWGVHRQGWPQSLVVQELLCLGKPLRGLCRENPLALGPVLVLVRHCCCLLISAALCLSPVVPPSELLYQLVTKFPPVHCVHTLPIVGECQQFITTRELWIFWELKKFKNSQVLALLKLGAFLL